MNGDRLGGSVLAGTLVFLVTAIDLTALLDPDVWPSALVALLFVALPVGLFAGVVAGLAAVTIRSGRENGSRPVA